MKAGMLFVLVAFIAVGLEMASARTVRGKQRPGVCPKVPPGTLGICITQCFDDESCPKGMKCCRNGCGFTCQRPLPAMGHSGGHVNKGLDIY